MALKCFSEDIVPLYHQLALATQAACTSLPRVHHVWLKWLFAQTGSFDGREMPSSNKPGWRWWTIGSSKENQKIKIKIYQKNSGNFPSVMSSLFITWLSGKYSFQIFKNLKCCPPDFATCPVACLISCIWLFAISWGLQHHLRIKAGLTAVSDVADTSVLRPPSVLKLFSPSPSR